jgi:prophage regulatory protein
MRDGGTLPGWPRVLRRELAAQYLGMSPSLFTREVEAGALPAPISLVGSVKAWVKDDLDAWLEDRRAAQNGGSNSWD